MAQYKGFLQDIRSIRGAASQIFGDPNNPNFKGLDAYADLADNKSSRDRLARALNMTVEADAASGGGHVGLGGFGISLGNVGKWVENQLGLPASVASQESKKMQEAVGALTAREREAYDAMLAASESVNGLRSITRQGVSVYNVKKLQDLLPKFGNDTASADQFRDKLGRLAVEVGAGTRGIPRDPFDAETQKQLADIEALPQRFVKGAGPKRAPVENLAPKTKGLKLTDKAIVKKYLDRANGNQDAAMKLARDDGWTF
jgi:hypothetical protein